MQMNSITEKTTQYLSRYPKKKLHTSTKIVIGYHHTLHSSNINSSIDFLTMNTAFKHHYTSRTAQTQLHSIQRTVSTNDTSKITSMIQKRAYMNLKTVEQQILILI
ncbi:Hypothetical_protein [Hexamita inflata]|uniref:Hypothetical_protein n=1 Tax=Hexamita inflata TaxID=28002 RepID=A0AA86PWR2_9EUKA|nr:Hypothetical protein HINF_LOCUS35450 [Hexamita inflata]